MSLPRNKNVLLVERILQNATRPLAQAEVQQLSNLDAQQVRKALQYLVTTQDSVISEPIPGTKMREYSIKRS